MRHLLNLTLLEARLTIVTPNQTILWCGELGLCTGGRILTWGIMASVRNPRRSPGRWRRTGRGRIVGREAGDGNVRGEEGGWAGRREDGDERGEEGPRLGMREVGDKQGEEGVWAGWQGDGDERREAHEGNGDEWGEEVLWARMRGEGDERGEAHWGMDKSGERLAGGMETSGERRARRQGNERMEMRGHGETHGQGIETSMQMDLDDRIDFPDLGKSAGTSKTNKTSADMCDEFHQSRMDVE